ncbi:helix-turn-helix transcriptional regulator [Nocardia paucivorans]|uniref:helix-turn-helix transcriptional regulator n=1 Tax=Nocardia paucivorans TaxID=114259 RepID=UPI00030CDE61|nr:helix-turn-helix domain-containing protein [Nocardia paucivorans]
MTSDDTAIGAIAALDDESRRGMYRFIRRARRPVTRDEAAAQVGISRKLAAFHLDKLVEAGLLRARYEAPAGIRRVGRAPKVYEPTEADVRVGIPERRYEILAEILMGAVLDERDGETARQTAGRVAQDRGAELGRAERERLRPGRLGAERALTLVQAVLAEFGFEPDRLQPTCVRLRNCPFHPLAEREPELVCELNREFCSGLLTGLGADAVQAVLNPRPGECCVELRAVTP